MVAFSRPVKDPRQPRIHGTLPRSADRCGRSEAMSSYNDAAGDRHVRVPAPKTPELPEDPDFVDEERRKPKRPRSGSSPAKVKEPSDEDDPPRQFDPTTDWHGLGWRDHIKQFFMETAELAESRGMVDEWSYEALCVGAGSCIAAHQAGYQVNEWCVSLCVRNRR